MSVSRLARCGSRSATAGRAALLAAALASFADAPAAAAVPDVTWSALESGPDRAAHAMAYDPDNDVVWLFGGIQVPGGPPQDDLYRLDAADPDARWQLVNAGGIRPPALALATLTFDPPRGRVLLYGGLDAGGDAVPPLNVWSLDVADPAAPVWSRASVPGNANPRFGHAAAYVAAFDALVVSGGFSTPTAARSDAWALVLGPGDPTWVRMANAGFFARGGHALIHDAQRQRLLAYGGTDRLNAGNAVAFMDTLDLSGGLDGADRWRRLAAQTPIGPRAFMAAGWDDTTRLWWHQGGTASGDQGLRELVVADLGPDSPIWTNTQVVAGGPNERFLAGAAWDSTRRRLIVHGGTRNQQQILRDAYALRYLDAESTPTATTGATATASASATTSTTATPTLATATTATATSTGDAPTPTSTTAPSATSTAWETHFPPTPTGTPTRPDATATATSPVETGPSTVYLPVAHAGVGAPTSTATAEPTTDPPTPPIEPSSTPPDSPTATASASPTTASSPTPPEPTPTATKTVSLELVGHLGGTTDYAALGAGFAFVDVGLDIVALAIAGGAADEVGRFGPLPSAARSLAASEQLVAVGHDAGVWLLQASATGDLSLAAAIPDARIAALALEGDRLVAGNAGTTTLYDVSDPTAPRALGSLGASGASAAAIQGDQVYVVYNTALLIARAEPDGLQEVARFPLEARPYGLDVAEGLAAVAHGNAGVALVDVADPAAPAARGTFQPEGFAESVALDGNTLWAGTNFFGLAAADISDPDAPAARGVLAAVGQRAHSVVASGGQVLITENNGGLSLVDGTDPDAPIRTGRFAVPGRATALRAEDDLAAVGFIGNGVGLVDVANPAAPTLLAVITDALRADAVAFGDDRLFTAERGDGVGIFGISDPTDPEVLGRFRQATGALDIAALGGDRVLVLDSVRGLVVLDVADPADAALVVELPLDDPPQAMAVDLARDLAIIATDGGLVVVDIADQAAPAVRGALPLPDEARAVALAGNLALVGTAEALVIVDVESAGAPAQRGTLAGIEPYTVAPAEGEVGAWVGTFRELAFVDLSDPDAPSIVASLALGARHFGLASLPGGVLAAGDVGLVALELAGR